MWPGRGGPPLDFAIPVAQLRSMLWHTVFQTSNPAAAPWARSQLDAAGFRINLANVLSALSIDDYAMAVGGITVQVPRDTTGGTRALLTAPPEGPA
jgi:hypothetical protein